MEAPAALAVPAFLAAAALILAASLKLIRPQRTYIALRLAGFPNGRGAVMALAAVEALAGTAVLATRSVPAFGVMGLLYLAFTVFLVRARRAGIACGCLTDSDHPPGWMHICLDALAAVVGFAALATAS